MMKTNLLKSHGVGKRNIGEKGQLIAVEFVSGEKSEWGKENFTKSFQEAIF